MLNKFLAFLGGFLIGLGAGQFFLFNNFIPGALCIFCGMGVLLMVAIKEKI